MSHPQLNPPGRPTRFRTTRALVLALLLAGLAPALDGKAPADSLRPDPVKEFVKLRDARQARQMARKWSLGDVSRILTSQTFDYVEPEVRQALIDSFDQKVREVVKGRDPGQQLALASRVAEMAVGSRSEGAGTDTRSSSSELRKTLRGLA